jgi:c-di-GMP-binding flagellar brake protein YcgR
MDKSQSGQQATIEDILEERSKITPRFVVGLNLYFDILTKTRRVKVRSQLVGWYRPHMLIVTMPLVDERALVMASGTELVVRYMIDGEVYGFLTRLLRKHHDPAPIWVLEYPGIVEVQNLRGKHRVQTFIQAKTDRDEDCLILDCSRTGALLAVTEKMEVGRPVTLNFTLPNGELIKDMETQVVRVFDSRLDTTVGVEFNPESVEQRKIIGDYVDEIARHQRMPVPAEYKID